MNLKGFREDKDIEDYYKSNIDLVSFDTHPGEHFADNLRDVWFERKENGDLNWQVPKKGESKQVGTVTFHCVDNNILKNDEMKEGDYSTINFKAEKLIMLTYEERPDDTIKLRYVFEGPSEGFCEASALYYLDSDEQENPLNYSGFQELYDILDALV